MAQTGVPFGDVAMVRDWLGIEAPVAQPENTHPKRPIAGFACRRSEVSGTRLWGWARERWGTPEQFFARFFVMNYCPLVFLEASGRNFTPDKIAVSERQALFTACDRALQQSIAALSPRYAIGIGDFATKRLQVALAGQAITIADMPHPSPANPQANRGWGTLADAALRAIGIG